MRRILIIDDNLAIHQDFRKVLNVSPEVEAQLAFLAAEAVLLGETPASAERPNFELEFASRLGSPTLPL